MMSTYLSEWLGKIKAAQKNYGYIGLQEYFCSNAILNFFLLNVDFDLFVFSSTFVQ